ncbi:MAG TPA: signal recognition particle-docking protein FtsY [Nitrosopumilaceae archaeon]|nr:signal recognition particle-docking protein FtsY [Nitrosopumilaceae archaeon]
MFENLRDAFSSAAKSLGERELKEKDIDEILNLLEISLLESDVATEVIDSIKNDLRQKLVGTKVNRKEIEKFVKDSLIQSISGLFDSAGTIDLLANINSKKESGEPYIILFVGINGTGKTTTLAKLAHLLQKSKFSVVIAAADTFRAGAIEQLKEHANRLNLKIVAQNYGSDPAAVARDAVLYAKSHKIDCVLVDTAGRMQTSKNLMDQIAKITNVVKPDFKIFVGDSLAGNDTVNQAKEFHEHTKFDAAILTKGDADARGGAALSIVKITSSPILYVGIGQEYKDLKAFDKELFLEAVFGKYDSSKISISDKILQKYSKPDSSIEEESISDTRVIDEPQITEKYDEIKTSDSDPFEGLDTKDINRYADLFDAPPPENDQQAQELAIKIKNWISDGRPKKYEKSKEEDTKKMNDDSEKPKKKQSLFGRFKK